MLLLYIWWDQPRIVYYDTRQNHHTINCCCESRRINLLGNWFPGEFSDLFAAKHCYLVSEKLSEIALLARYYTDFTFSLKS